MTSVHQVVPVLLHADAITAHETTRFNSSSCNLPLVRCNECSSQIIAAANARMLATAIVIHKITAESKACS